MSENDLLLRIESLEASVKALSAVVNRLLEDVYEPEFIGKLDKLVENGETDK